MSTAAGLRWDLSSYFDEFDGPAMRAFKDKLSDDVFALQADVSALNVLSMDNLEAWENILIRAENVGARMGHISSYVNNLSSCDARDERYSLELGRLSQLSAENEKIDADLQRGFKTADEAAFDALLARPAMAGAEHFLRRLRQRAQFTMPVEQEKLAAELGVDGLHSWGRLYDTLSGKLEFEMQWPNGTVERKPISQWRTLISDADPAVRRAAFDGGNRAWATIEDVCAAALNAISGTRLTLYKHRGIQHFLQMALFQSAIEKPTLDAMYQAIHSELEVPREIFQAKAQALGRTGIDFFAREAPLPLETNAKYSWEEGSQLVSSAFDSVYPKLGSYYRDFLGRGWMESEVRPGKRPGAYCTGSAVTGEQRVYMTFNGSLNEVSTVAHELGHAFHSHLLKEMRPVAQRYPMTLAETASIFAELILAEGVRQDPSIDAASKLQMLDADLCGAAILLLDITVRFEFEKALYDQRKSGEVSVTQLKNMMVEKQQQVFGEALAAGGEDPYFWASKLHFYITRTSFYNFPYTFGFLLARALFAMFQREGDSFLPRYEAFLQLTGSDTVENVARRALNVDVQDPEFWAESIRSMRPALEQYKSLLAGLQQTA
jgi:oligoendopeptidase F